MMKIAMKKDKQKRATLHGEAGKASLRKWHLSASLKFEKEPSRIGAGKGRAEYQSEGKGGTGLRS